MMRVRTIWQSIIMLLTGSSLLFNPIRGQDQGWVMPQIPPYVLRPPSHVETYPADPTGTRNYSTTTTRDQVPMQGFWDFITDPEDKGEKDKYFQEFPEPETKLWVPGSWNSIAKYWNYIGAAWYKNKFILKKGGDIRLRFGSAGYYAQVWLDGRYLGDHTGGFTPFVFHVPDLSQGIHNLVVKVDNRLTNKTIPKNDGGWFPYGGLYRPVYLECVNDKYIDNFFVIPTYMENGNAGLKVKAFIKNNSGKSAKTDIRFLVNNKELYLQSHTLRQGDSTLEFGVEMESPSLWSPDEPNLHMARVVLGKEEDDQLSRFGIREFSRNGYKVLLNGKWFKLKGVNHHDDHPDWGAALPANIIRQDIEIIKRLGGNAVRQHYPPSEMFLDFCDEAGIVFMEEVPAWQQDATQLRDSEIKENIKKQFYEMVYRDMNHPAIFSWSLGNEWGSDLNKDGEPTHKGVEEASQSIAEMVEYARSVDNSHFITIVTSGSVTNSTAKLLDLICVNWAYFLWYGGSTTLQYDENSEKAENRLKAIHESFPEMPLILSEFGGSGSQAGWHNWGNAKWSEEFQAANVYQSARFVLNTEWLSGGCVWQMCDSRESLHRILGPRLRGWNVKGIVDGSRQPKLSFYNLQKAFKEFPHGPLK